MSDSPLGTVGLGPTVIVLPVGPEEDTAGWLDTVDSIDRFADPDTCLLLLDDTRRPDFAGLVPPLERRVEVLVGPGRSGLYGGLAALVCCGLAHAVGPMGAGQVFRMDTDAVMIKPGLEDAARRAFSGDVGLGAVGSFRTGPTGESRDFGPAAELLDRDLGRRGLRHPRWSLMLRSLVRTAERRGYERGEHALGAAQMFSRLLLMEWSARGWISPTGGPAGVEASLLGDDHLLGLMVRAAGFRTGDLGRPGDALAVSWRGLPYPPAQLLASDATVVHSVKDWGDQRESDVRAAFRQER